MHLERRGVVMMMELGEEDKGFLSVGGRWRSSVIGLWTESKKIPTERKKRRGCVLWRHELMAGEKAPDPKVDGNQKWKEKEVNPWRSHRSKLLSGATLAR